MAACARSGPSRLGGSLLLFLPFHLDHFRTAATGLGIVGDHDNFTRFAADVLLIYGLLLWILLAVAVTRLSVPVRYLVWGGVLATFVLVLLAPARLAGLVLLLVLVACSLDRATFALDGWQSGSSGCS